MKLIGNMIIMVISIVMGYLSSRKFYLRQEFLKGYIELIDHLKKEILYSQECVSSILKKYKSSKYLNRFIDAYVACEGEGYSFKYSWEQSLKMCKEGYGLCEVEIEQIERFGNEFGKSDAEGELNLCELHEKNLKGVLKNVKEEKPKKSRLYFMLWAFAGLLVILIFGF